MKISKRTKRFTLTYKMKLTSLPVPNDQVTWERRHKGIEPHANIIASYPDFRILHWTSDMLAEPVQSSRITSKWVFVSCQCKQV